MTQIHAAILSAMKEIALTGIAKLNRNTAQNYNFRGIEAARLHFRFPAVPALEPAARGDQGRVALRPARAVNNNRELRMT